MFRITQDPSSGSDNVYLTEITYNGLNVLSSGIVYSRLQTVTIPDAVIILVQFVLLKMGMLMLETCRGL
jgi:hypothetical protein